MVTPPPIGRLTVIAILLLLFASGFRCARMTTTCRLKCHTVKVFLFLMEPMKDVEDAKSRASMAARRMFTHVWQPMTADSDFPVDPIRISRALGIDVFDTQLDLDVSGAIIKEPGQDPAILLNSTDSANRKRFTCAHEVGHFVRRADELDDYEFVDYRNANSSTGDDTEEMYANAFAACLLMPEWKVKELLKSGSNEIEMALFFDVSREAMNTRLRSLRL